MIPDLMIILLGVLPLSCFLFKTYPRLMAADSPLPSHPPEDLLMIRQARESAPPGP
jgi:hypothetical protein